MSEFRETSRPAAGQSWLGLRPGTLVVLVAIAVLLVPLSALSQPADSTNPGGFLARLRANSASPRPTSARSIRPARRCGSPPWASRTSP